MSTYYTQSLAGERLKRCYELAPPAVRQYLDAEIAFALEAIDASCRVLELGCGYGRILRRLAQRTRALVGIDLSRESLALARRERVPAQLAQMNALTLGVRDATFDVTVCLQTGVSAVGADPHELLTEALRVTRPGGRMFLSSYAERFWGERLRWFELQAAHGLVGAIDYSATGGGTIVCRDGFRATTMTPEAFQTLAKALGCTATVTEVAGAAVVCEIRVPREGGRRI